MNEPNPEPKKAKKTPGKKKFDINPFSFETRNGRYWFQNPKSIWLELPPREFARYISVHFGVSLKRIEGTPSAAERIMTEIQDNRTVNVVTSLAGYFGPKVITHDGMVILIKDGPSLITPKEGDYPTLTLLLSGMLTGLQYDHNLWWTAQSADDLYNQRKTLSTASGWCGPHSAGKSLWQSLLTLILGGRMARPYQFMSGRTVFNAHMARAEHLMIEDEHSASDLKSRLALGTAIKAIIANQEKESHAKYGMPFITPRLFQRLTLSLNDRSENVALLPPGDVSLDHKVNLYDVNCVPMPMPCGTTRERELFWATLVAELPAFIWDLLHQVRVPEEWRDNRFGVKAYRAPRILELMDEHEPHEKLLDLLDIMYFGNNDLEHIAMLSGERKEGTASEIEAELRHLGSPVKSQADDLLRGPSYTGKYLMKLSEKHPERVSFKFKHEKRKIYSIFAPKIATQG